MLDILGIDDDEAVGQAAVLGMEAIEALDGGEHVAMTVDDDQGRRIGQRQIGGDQVLQRLRFAVAGAADDVHVLKAGGEGYREGERRLHVLSQRRAAEVGGDHLRRRQIAVLGPDNSVRRRLRLLRRQMRYVENVLPELDPRVLEGKCCDGIRRRWHQLLQEGDQEAGDERGRIAEGIERHGEGSHGLLERGRG